MEQFRFAQSELAFLFFLIPMIIALFGFAYQIRKKALLKFAQSKFHPNLIPSYSFALWITKSIFIIIALIFLIFAIMRPQGDPHATTIKKEGRDLIFVLDVSKSMLAEDLKPNRLERAKQLISDVVDQLTSDRVGLLIFAGTTAIKSPLTIDYYYFKKILQHVSINDINLGGTHIGDAIRNVTDKFFQDHDQKYRDVILITDGEDHESFPIEAAKAAAEKGIRIHTVGLGDPDGANIPIRQDHGYELLKYKAQTIRSKLDEKTLKKIAQITNGIFIPVRTSFVDLGNLYQKYILPQEKRAVKAKKSIIWQELFQFPLGLAILFLMLESLIFFRKKTFPK